MRHPLTLLGPRRLLHAVASQSQSCKGTFASHHFPNERTHRRTISSHTSLRTSSRPLMYGPVVLAAAAATAAVVTAFPMRSVYPTARPLTVLSTSESRTLSSTADAQLPETIGHFVTPIDVHYCSDSTKHALEQLRSAEVTEQGDSAFLNPLKQCCASDGSAVTLTLIGYKGGDLNQQVNQDRSVIWKPYMNNDAVLVTVCDGHAPLGEGVAEYASQNIPRVLQDKLQKLSEYREKDIRQILEETFVQMDKEVPAEESGGATASVVLKLKNRIYLANVGDSTSIIVTYRPSTKKIQIAYQTREDKPDLPDERRRVEQMGGQVYIPLKGTSRVVYHDAHTGVPTGLAMSRSLGDWQAGALGVIPNPIVGTCKVDQLVTDAMSNPQEGDDDVYIFSVSATDGLWDFLDVSDVARVVAEAFGSPSKEKQHVVTACERLVYAAANAWRLSKQGRYRDDITIAVSLLRTPPKR